MDEESKYESKATPQPAPSSNPYFVPSAIVVAGVIIAGAVVYSSGARPAGQLAGNSASPPTVPASPAADNITPIRNDDHVLGSPEAPVKIVEFSDLECPFCKSFHPTMQQVIQAYGQDGRVAWIYRHFPLDAIHPKADKEAEATECANELGGNSKFWAYVDRLFAITPSNNNLNPAELPKIAEYVGLDSAAFEACLASGKYAAHVEADYQDALASGGEGTPYSVVIAKNGEKFVVSGAQPYAAVKAVIDLALQEK